MSVKSISPLPAGRLASGADGWLVVHPDHRTLLALHHLDSPADLLDLPAIVVNGHVGRNVSSVRLGELTAYLKREHRVALRTRWKNFLAGFGFVSMSEREANVLRYLESQDLNGPGWLAYGEYRGAAFLLVSDAGTPAPTTNVRALAIAVARIHHAGVDQPDLFAKHVFTDAAGRITLLDWQQARLGRETSPSQRIRSLAALLATAPEHTGRTDRLRFLKAYLAESGAREWKPFARLILAEAAILRKRPGIRRQRTQATAACQPLVRIQGETVCAIPAVADDLRNEVIIRQLHDASRTSAPVMLPAGTRWKAAEYRQPWGRLWAAVRGKAWRSAELKLARLVMHLERHGIPAPGIVAYGQRTAGLLATSFVAYEGSVAAESRMKLPELVRALHAAGVVLRDLPGSARPFAIVDGRAVVNDPACFELVKKLSWHHMERANRWLEALAG